MSESTTASYTARRQQELELEDEEARSAAETDALLERLRTEFAAEDAGEAGATPEAPAGAEGAGEDVEESENFPLYRHVTEALKGLVRGPVKEGFDIIDNIGSAVHNNIGEPAAEALGLMTPEQIERSRALREEAGPVGAQLDEKLGAPETITGQLVEGFAGELAYLLPAARVAAAGRATSAGKIFATGASSAVVSPLLQSEDEGNLGNLARDLFGDNFYSDIFAIDGDDSQLVRFAKNAGEDIAMSVAVESLLKGFRMVRGTKAEAAEILEVAAKDGDTIDNGLAESIDNYVDARGKQESLVDPKTTPDDVADAAEAAELRGETLAEPSEADELVGRLKGAVGDARVEIDQQAAQAESALLDAAAAANATPEMLEAIRVTLRKNGVSTPKVDEALGRAVDRNLETVGAKPTPPPKDSVVGNYLNVTADQADKIEALAGAEDIDGVIEFLGDSVFDSTNYERIAADEEGGVVNLIKAVGQITGNADSSKRLLTTETLAETEAGAWREVARLASERGATPEAIVAALDESLPGAGLAQQLNALRTTELGLARKLHSLGELRKADPSAWGNEQRLEFLRFSTLLANVTDRRSGVVSEIGRALSSLRINASGAGYEGIMNGARAIRAQEIEGVLAGRAGHLDKMIDMMVSAGDNPKLLAKLAKDTVKDEQSALDILHHTFLGNILSGPGTQSLNLLTSSIRGLVYAPLERAAEASGRAIHHGDVRELKAVGAELYGIMEGLAGALRVAHSSKGWEFGSAWKSANDGRPVTGRSALEKFDANPSLLTDSVPALASRTAGRFSRTAGQKTEAALAGTSLAARATKWGLYALDAPFRGLAFGDEVIKAASKHGRMKGQTYTDGLHLGFEGDELADYIAKRVADVNDLPTLKAELDITDPEQALRLRRAIELDKLGNNQAQVSTFTEEPGKLLNGAIRVKEVVPGARWFVPFLNTPGQLIKQSWKHFSVVGPGMDVATGLANRRRFRRIQELGDVQAADPGAMDWMPGAKGFDPKNYDPEELAEASGRLALTGALNLSMLGAIHAGLVEGSGPVSFEEREVGSLSRSYGTIQTPFGRLKFDRFDPVALPLTVMADLYDMQGRLGEEETDSLIAEFWGKMFNAIQERSWLEGMMNLTQLLEDPERYARRWVVNTSANMVPMSRFWSSIRKAEEIPEGYLDVSEGGERMLLTEAQARILVQDEVEGFDGMLIQLGSTIGANIPTAASQPFLELWQKVFALRMETEQVAARDFFYDVRTYDRGLGPDMGTPFQTDPAGDMNDPVASELERLGYGASVGRRFGEIDGVKLSPKQQDKFQRYFAKPKGARTIREELESLMLDSEGSPAESWAALGDDPVEGVRGGKRTILDQIIGARMRAAKGRLVAEDEDLRKEILQNAMDAGASMTAEGSDEVRQRRLNESPISALFQK
jgi:hypothetical protein